MRTVETLVQSYPLGVQTLAHGARGLIRRLLPAIEESVDSSAPVIAYGYGSGYRGMVCTLILSKSGVKLGLVRGADLDDPWPVEGPWQGSSIRPARCARNVVGR